MKISDINEVETIGTICDNDLNFERYDTSNIDISKYGAFPTTGNVPEMDPIPHEEGMPNIEVTYTDNTINALNSFEAFMSVANQHRPYESSDFVKEYYIPDNI